MEFVTRVWKDSVWSKVIAAGILWELSKLHDHFAVVQLPQWLDRTFSVVELALVAFAGLTFLVRKRSPTSNDTLPTSHGIQRYQIEIHTEEGRPYHDLVLESGHLLSTVRVGIKNVGEKTLSNCRVYVEKVTPPANALVQSAILLENAVFNLRCDDPEELVDVANHWDHFNEFRFSAPGGTGFYESMQYMDGKIKRTFVVRVAARECERSALFEIWADDSKRLHLKFLNYLLN